jgi:phosphatidylinositol alpha-mannosyltransferase
VKIGLVTPYDWSYPGGVREHVRHLAQEFRKMGLEVRILAPVSREDERLADEHVYKMAGASPVPFNGSIARVALNPYLGRRVRSVLQHERFDIIHLHEPLIPGLPLTVLRFSRAINVGTFHAFANARITSTPYLAYASLHRFLRPYFRRLAGRIAVSPAAYQFVSRYFPADYRLIPNGVDLERFNIWNQPWPWFMDGRRNILFVGRFEKRKGAKYLLRAIPAIRERHPDTRFIFVGEGSLKRGFERFVEKQGWPEVVFAGRVSADELPRYFASAHLFCAPSIGGESLGVVLLEAMASGVPVVASNIEGYATVVSHGYNGLLAPARDSPALSAAICRLLEDEPLRRRLIEAGLQTAELYAWPRIARRILDYYRELIEERQPLPAVYEQEPV